MDSLIELGGDVWRFVDTAGLRRKVGQASGHEFYASVRTHAAIDSAEVAIVLIDASQPLTEQDLRVISMVIEAGRALVLAYNKWDLVDEDRRELLQREIDRELVQVRWAQRVNISAKTGRAVHKLVPAMEDALASWDTRIATGPLNTWLTEVTAATPRRCAAASSHASCSRPRPPRGHRRSCCSPRVFWRPAIGGSWSGGCVRRSGLTAARSGSTCGCERSGPASAAERTSNV